MMKIFERDGQLYDESLTRNTYKQAESLERRIISRIHRYGYINITWIVVNYSKLPEPKNFAYAVNHGWTGEDIPKFHIRHCDDGRFGIYLGTPRLLTSDIVLKKYKKKHADEKADRVDPSLPADIPDGTC